MSEDWIVRHKERGVWLVDRSTGDGWTKEQAEAHAARCEYAEHGIEFEIVKDSPILYEPKSGRGRTKPPIEE